ncbi:hypothetical protein So717_35190 [Roseobacter cerasinus]|uniref:Uncharacterized protein n=1 Tax=Roseobacter cerasinus TaxID=2602289 RepID=A0A640VZX8_9RHOB|nr:hypothetical protein [Roseobacter cerasinus]GFE51766.1 hypothetical protein So717_35190 [Roseobacter cerasinus]
MTDPSNVAPLPSDLSDRVLTLNLVVKSDQSVTIRSSEMLGRGFRNRISFQAYEDVDQILAPKLAHALRKCLISIPEGTQVLSLPDFLVELPGLVLSGVHVLIMEAKSGMRNAIVRFKEFMGALNNAFLTNIGLQEPYANHAERLATNVLADICLPLLNMCRDLEYAQVDSKDRLPTGFAERAKEFEFQTELLKRFIFNAGIGHAQPTEMHLERYTAPEKLGLPEN